MYLISFEFILTDLMDFLGIDCAWNTPAVLYTILGRGIQPTAVGLGEIRLKETVWPRCLLKT